MMHGFGHYQGGYNESPAAGVGRAMRPESAIKGLRANQVPGYNPNPAHRAVHAVPHIPMPRPQMSGQPMMHQMPGLMPAQGGSGMAVPQQAVLQHQLGARPQNAVAHILQMLGGH